MQIWEKEGCGTDNATLRQIIGEYRKDGVQGIESCGAITEYMEKLPTGKLLEMYRIDSEATLQILADYTGIKAGLESAIFMSVSACESLICEEMQKNGWISPNDYEEACKKYDERVAAAQAKADTAEERMFEAVRRQQEAEQEAAALQYEIVTLKAKLYDTYEALHDPTTKTEQKGDHSICRVREKTQSGSWG